MQIARRSFLKGVGLVVAAPAIVKVESLMRLPSKPKIVRPDVLGQLPPGAYIISSNGEFVIDFQRNCIILKGDLSVDGQLSAKEIKVAHHLPS